MQRLSFTGRIEIAITGEVKAFIPSPSSIDGMNGLPLATFNTKPEQLRTNIGWVYAPNSAIVDDVSAATLRLYKLRKAATAKRSMNTRSLSCLRTRC